MILETHIFICETWTKPNYELVVYIVVKVPVISIKKGKSSQISL